MPELRPVHWSIPGYFDGRKTPAMMLLESSDFNKYGGGRGLKVIRLSPSYLARENGPGWKMPDIPAAARAHLPDGRTTLEMTRGEFAFHVSEQFYEPMMDATEAFADRFNAAAPDLMTEVLLRWNNTYWPIDWSFSYQSVFLGHSRIMGPQSISQAGFSAFDLVDEEFLATKGESGDPLCVSVFLDPAKPGMIHVCATLPVLDKEVEDDLSALLCEILNAAAIAWRTRTRATLILRHTEYIYVSFEESSIEQPIPTIRISTVQHDNPAHPNTSPHPWGFTFLNLVMANLSWWFKEGGDKRWQPCQQDRYYERHCKPEHLVESPESQSEALPTIEEESGELPTMWWMQLTCSQREPGQNQEQG